jgi:ketosteroid isomerase-like protein
MVSETNSKAEVVATYFDALDAGDFELAAEQFTSDVTYIHPPMYGGATHIHGRDELLEFMTETRGETDSIHVTDRSTTSENVVALVGHIEPRSGGEPIDHYVAYATFDGDRIDHYIAGLLRG